MICTHNRAHLLPGALAALAAEVGGDGRAEVLVVDSASTDVTPDIVAQLSTTVPSLHYHRVALPGLSRAREVALGAARGEVVAFLDDDAVVHAGWLGAIREGFADGGVAAVGGPIVLQWTDGQPRWMTTSLEHWYSGLDRGPTARDLGPTEFLWGTNLAVRRSSAMAAGGFAPELGRIGSSLLSGEEIDLQRRLEAAGHRRRHVPGAVVTHLVGGERRSLRWVFRRAWWQGRSEAVYDRVCGRRLALALVARRVAAHAGHGLGRDLGAILAGPRRAGAVVHLLGGRLTAAGYAREALNRPGATGRAGRAAGARSGR